MLLLKSTINRREKTAGFPAPSFLCVCVGDAKRFGVCVLVCIPHQNSCFGGNDASTRDLVKYRVII